MEITDVQIIKVKDKKQLLAYVNVVLNDVIVLKGIKLIDGVRGKFIVMPSQTVIKRKEIKKFEYYHPINNDVRKLLENIIIEKYNEVEK